MSGDMWARPQACPGRRSLAAACLLLTLQAPAVAQVDLMDDDVFSMVAFDELELSGTGDDRSLSWEGDAWIGTDLRRFWLKTEGEQLDGETEEAELELMFSRAIKPFWNLQAGLRHDFRPTPDQDWLAVSILGLAPYWYEVEASFYVGEGGQQSLRVETSYELLLKQRLVLEPEADIALYGETDPARRIGSGLSSFGLGVRLRYEIKREIAPYIGLRYERVFGDTADLAELAGDDTGDWKAVVGIRFWY